MAAEVVNVFVRGAFSKEFRSLPIEVTSNRRHLFSLRSLSCIMLSQLPNAPNCSVDDCKDQTGQRTNGGLVYLNTVIISHAFDATSKLAIAVAFLLPRRASCSIFDIRKFEAAATNVTRGAVSMDCLLRQI